MRRTGFDIGRQPILKPLTIIERRNAIINDDGSAAAWPKSDVIIAPSWAIGPRARPCRRAA